jgi:hypothetical protein
MLLLALALFVFYVVFTPAWIGIRLVAWLSERRPAPGNRSPATPPPTERPPAAP